MENVAEGAPTVPGSPRGRIAPHRFWPRWPKASGLPEAYQNQAITALGRLRQEDRCALESSLGYVMNPKAV